MLNDKSAIATVGVKDMQAAAAFYEGKLGLEKFATEGEEVTSYRSGKSIFNVYRSDYAGTNKATAVTWMVGDELDTIVSTLKSRGVVFEHYDLPEMKREGDIHIHGELRVVWFKDPDGNILTLVNG
ncbi:VOC family protein [Undibacterium terreum]|uniref:Glyoxalase n=1 Tax=Undibacterium terreum TaxID=1224302 RepID=A0A916U8R4_9BURK|nr:VOC family protein [Undibacterium terreum]GGC64008.1 glyoxalase [Undibacterium terreum]